MSMLNLKCQIIYETHAEILNYQERNTAAVQRYGPYGSTLLTLVEGDLWFVFSVCLSHAYVCD